MSLTIWSVWIALRAMIVCVGIVEDCECGLRLLQLRYLGGLQVGERFCGPCLVDGLGRHPGLTIVYLARCFMEYQT